MARGGPGRDIVPLRRLSGSGARATRAVPPGTRPFPAGPRPSVRFIPLVLGIPALAFAQARPGDGVPRDGVTARALANGVTVWHHAIPGDSIVRVTLIVAGGAALDPDGQPGLAHFAEHAVFGAIADTTELERNRQIEGRGGRIQARTSWEQTAYTVTIPAAQGSYAIRWLGTLVAQHPLDESEVRRQQGPFALEVGAAPVGRVRRVLRSLLKPAWLQPPSRWHSVFGLRAPGDVRGDAATALAGFAARDVATFLAGAYRPQRLTLVVSGGLPLDSAVVAADAALGHLPEGPATELPRSSVRPRGSRSSAYTVRRTASYSRELRATGLAPGDRTLWQLTAELLEQRLGDRLRWGGEKLVYHPAVAVETMFDAGVITVAVESSPASIGRAQAIVDEEVARLRSGTGPDSVFATALAPIRGRLGVALQGRDALVDLAVARYWDPAPGSPYPHPRVAADSLTPMSVASFLAAHAPQESDASRLVAPWPIPTPAIAAALLVTAVGVVGVARRVLTRPVTMARVRYVAHVRPDLPSRLAWIAILGVPAAAGAVVVYNAGRRMADATILALPGPWLQLVGWLLVAAAASAVLIGAGALLPHKVLVFDDHVRLKRRAYRSTILPLAGTSVALAAPGLARGGRRTPRLFPLALTGRRPAILLSARDGRSCCFRVRDTKELADVLRDLASHAPAADATDADRHDTTTDPRPTP